MKALKFTAVCLVIMSLAGCANLSRQQQRMLSGGAIGAAGGAVLTVATGGSVLAGTLIGGAAGTAVGASMK